jgi:hypothetical protein
MTLELKAIVFFEAHCVKCLYHTRHKILITLVNSENVTELKLVNLN